MKIYKNTSDDDKLHSYSHSDKYTAPLISNFLQEIRLPLAILKTNNLSALEAIVKYLRENKDLTYKEISQLLSRNPKTLAVTYSIASRKLSEKIIVQTDSIFVDFSIFNNDLSILEAICSHLKSRGKKYSQISRMIGKSQKTIWTVCKRAEEKQKKDSESKKNDDANSLANKQEDHE